VAGIADFGMFTILLSRPGWLKRIPQKWANFSEIKNHPGQTVNFAARKMILWSGHPSLKKGGEIFVPKTPLVDGYASRGFCGAVILFKKSSES